MTMPTFKPNALQAQYELQALTVINENELLKLMDERAKHTNNDAVWNAYARMMDTYLCQIRHMKNIIDLLECS